MRARDRVEGVDRGDRTRWLDRETAQAQLGRCAVRKRCGRRVCQRRFPVAERAAKLLTVDHERRQRLVQEVFLVIPRRDRN